MARYTIREFTEAVGLGKDRDSVTRSGIILKALCGLGIAREVGKKHGSNGRPAVVYEVQDPIVMPLGVKVSNFTERESLAEKQVEETQTLPSGKVEEPVAVASAPTGSVYHYGDDDED